MRRILIALFSVMLASACLGLGVWQLRRLSARRAANRAALSERAQPILTIDSGPGLPLPNRRVRISGELDEAREFLIRDRVIQGVPAIMVVTPLRRAAQDTAILINRGYVPAPDAVNPGNATWSERGSRIWQGVLLAVPDGGDGAPLVYAGRETWRRLDLTAMRGRLPYPLAPLYLIAEADSAAGAEHTIRGTSYPFRAEPPPLDEGPHLMYAVQWFGIAVAVLAFAYFFVWRGVSQRPTA